MTDVLVTGVTGQDGGYLVERLLVEGATVHGLVHLEDQNTEQFRRRYPSVVLHTADLRDGQRLQDVLAVSSPTEVYNLAGISSVALSWREPVLTAEVTGVGPVRLMQALREHAERTGTAPRFLQASSAEIFGAPESSPQDETTPIRPVSPYGAAKAYAHHMVAAFRAQGLHACTVILYNHESPRRPTTFVTRKITRTVAQIASGRGSELVMGNLDARRDWGWAPDYVEAMVRAMRHPAADDYVVATSEEHSVRDFIAVAFGRVGITDWEPYVRTDPDLLRPLDAAALVGNAHKAREVLGWAPTVSFEDVVGAMVDHDLAEVGQESVATARATRSL